MVRADPLGTVFESDRPRVLAAARDALERGKLLDISYRMRHKNGELIWLHLNARRLDPLAESIRLYAVFTGMSPETRLFQSITNEAGGRCLRHRPGKLRPALRQRVPAAVRQRSDLHRSEMLRGPSRTRFSL